ncbi:MAG: glycosyltransferase [Candidatus Zixiibacteriota bacterium]|nr:MAG: glycosyltransferase [candidate division Zixibacteria bacterium]
MNRNNNEKPGSSGMTVGINAFNVRSKSDYRYANKLIECLGGLAEDRAFILIGREGQEDYFIPAPVNFKYRFYKLYNPVSETVNPRIDKLFDDVLAEFGCDLLLEFGLGGASDIAFPKVSIINSFEMFGSGNIDGKSSCSARKLKLINKTAVNNIKKSRGIIFSSPYLQDEISRIAPMAYLKTTSIYLGAPDSGEKAGQKVCSKYGIDIRYLISLISSAGMKESLRMLHAYCQAFEKGPDAPDLVLVGADENPEDVCVLLEAINKLPLNSRIKYVGTIPDEDFSVLLGNARVLVFPHEIFNSVETLVTAMNCGCAILCANNNKPQEITDGAALYFNPENLSDLAFKLKLIVDDEELAGFLKKQSEIRAALFSREEIASRLMDFLDDVVVDFKNAAVAKSPENTVA